jgi:ribosomal protein S18 acetylase RimI-like enzyme
MVFGGINRRVTRAILVLGKPARSPRRSTPEAYDGAARSPGVRVRTATPADAERIAVVARESCEAAYEGLLDDPALLETVRSDGYTDEIREFLRAVPEAAGLRYDVVETEGRVEGFAHYRFAPAETDSFVGSTECLLHSLYVAPDRWGEGLGSALVDASDGRLPDRLSALVLGVLKRNEVGTSFYESSGFERRGEAVLEVSGAGYDCWVYARPR